MNTFYDYEDAGYFDFQGSDEPYFVLDGRCFEARESGDGYRSYLSEVVEVTLPDHAIISGGGQTVAEVRVEEYLHGNKEGYRLIDRDGKVWLEFGTDDYDAYYPSYIYREH